MINGNATPSVPRLAATMPTASSRNPAGAVISMRVKFPATTYPRRSPVWPSAPTMAGTVVVALVEMSVQVEALHTRTTTSLKEWLPWAYTTRSTPPSPPALTIVSSTFVLRPFWSTYNGTPLTKSATKDGRRPAPAVRKRLPAASTKTSWPPVLTPMIDGTVVVVNTRRPSALRNTSWPPVDTRTITGIPVSPELVVSLPLRPIHSAWPTSVGLLDAALLQPALLDAFELDEVLDQVALQELPRRHTGVGQRLAPLGVAEHELGDLAAECGGDGRQPGVGEDPVAVGVEVDELPASR